MTVIVKKKNYDDLPLLYFYSFFFFICEESLSGFYHPGGLGAGGIDLLVQYIIQCGQGLVQLSFCLGEFVSIDVNLPLS